MNALEKYVAKKVLVEKLAASIPGVPKVPGVPGVPKQPQSVAPPVVKPTIKPVGVPGLSGPKGGVPPKAVTIPPLSVGKTGKPGSFMPKKREVPLTLTPR